MDQGWSDIPSLPCIDRVYASSSAGSDANSGRTESSPKKTLRAAHDAIRNGVPTHLHLRRGDTFTDALGGEYLNWTKSGALDSAPTVVWTYGREDAPRPLLDTGARDFGFFIQQDTPVQFVWLVDLDFAATQPATKKQTGVSIHTTTRHFRMEGCLVRRHSTNVSLAALPGHSLEYFTLLRNGILDAAPSPQGEHSQGLYATGLFESGIAENVFDRNGGVRTIYDHNSYIQPSCDHVTFDMNLSSRASATGLQLRGQHQNAFRNLLLDNPINLSVGHAQAPLDQRWKGDLWRNVCVGGDDIDASTPRGQSLWLSYMADGGSVTENVVTELRGGSACCLRLEGDSTGGVVQGNQFIDAQERWVQDYRADKVYPTITGNYQIALPSKRTVATYMERLGYAGDRDYLTRLFIENVRVMQTDRRLYSEAFTAQAAGEWIRNG